MLVSEVEQEVDIILDLGSVDPERAHSYEDDLYRCVLQATAEGDSDAAALARAALKTQAGGFSRRCA